MNFITAELARASELYWASDYRRAEQVARQVVASDPGNADAVYLLGQVAEALGDETEALFNYRQAAWLRPDLTDATRAITRLEGKDISSGAADRAAGLNTHGIILAQHGRYDEAERHFREALAARPGWIDARVNLGVALALQRRFAEALASYEEVLRERPTDPSLWANLSDLLRESGDYEGAAAQAREALRLDPNLVAGHINLGSALLMLRRPEEAAGHLRRALAAQPDHPDACSNLGEALRQQTIYLEAIDWCRRAIELRPGFAQAYNHLGLALTGLNRLEEAVVSLREAVRLKPALLDAHTNLGLAYWRQGRFDDAEACSRAALAVDPGFVDAHNNLGVLASKKGRLDEALGHYARAIELRPDSPTTHFYRGLVLLVQGDLAEGFREYEWRRRCVGMGVKPLPGPEWDGGPFPGRSLILHAEQGLGDTLQFVRYARLAKERGGEVVVAAPPALHPLLKRCPGVDRLVASAAPPDPTALHAHLLSLPHRFGTTHDTIPGEVPYLFAPEDRTAHWADRLSGLRGRKVGLVWQGNPYYPEDRFRSIPLAAFVPLGRVPGVQLIGLQVGAGREQMVEVAGQIDLLDFGAELDPTPGALADAAGLIRNLDLLITCDSALAHLAGGMGVPAWVAVPFSPDWRWLLDRDDSLWYPSLRLFRAPAPADWGPVVDRMVVALGDRFQRGPTDGMPE